MHIAPIVWWFVNNGLESLWNEVVVVCVKILSPWWPGGIQKRQTIISAISNMGSTWKHRLSDTRLSVTTTSTVVWSSWTQTSALFCRLVKLVRCPLGLDPVDIINTFCVTQQLKSFLGRVIVEVSISHTISYTTTDRTPLKDWSARRRDHLPTHSKHKGRTTMPSDGIRTSVPNNRAAARPPESVCDL